MVTSTPEKMQVRSSRRLETREHFRERVSSPKDLTGFSAALQVRETFDSTTPVVSLTNGSGITLGGVLGTINVIVSSSATSAIPAGYYSYDLEITSGAGVRDRLLEGKFVVTPEVTR